MLLLKKKIQNLLALLNQKVIIQVIIAKDLLIKILIILSPIAILCLTNQSTEPFFKSWFKSFLALLILQIIVAIILLISFTLSKETSNALLNKILLVGGISALLKANQFVKELIGGLGINSNIQTGLSNLKSIFAK